MEPQTQQLEKPQQLSTEQRVEKGWNQLGKDVMTLIHNRKEIGQKVHNAIPRAPQEMTKFDFFDVMKIVAVMAAMGIVIVSVAKLMMWMWALPI